MISSVHCEIDFRDGVYWLTDCSTNGTFLNGAAERLSSQAQLRDGDLIAIGQYMVRVSFAGDTRPARAPTGGSAEAPAPTGASLWGTLDEKPDTVATTDAFGLPKRKAIFSSGDRPVEEAFRPPEAISRPADIFGLGGGGSAPGYAAPPPAQDIFGLGGTPPAAPSPSAWPAAAPSAGGWPAAPAATTSPASIWGTLTAPVEVDFTPPPPAATPVAAAAPPPAAAGVAAPGAVAAAEQALFARFLAGAGLRARDVDELPPGSVLAAAGELLRQTADGLIQLLYARARLRNQFGVGTEVTSFQRDGNNPLKWTRSAEEALRQIVGKPDRGFLPGPQAVRGAFEDLQAHEMALMAAMQEALKDTIQRFSPAAIRARPSQSNLLQRLLPGARDAALWQAYEAEFNAMANETEAAYLDLFAKNFKKAYARNLARVDGPGR
jgi:type VI secretion system FHA domain protein